VIKHWFFRVYFSVRTFFTLDNRCMRNLITILLMGIPSSEKATNHIQNQENPIDFTNVSYKSTFQTWSSPINRQLFTTILLIKTVLSCTKAIYTSLP